MKRSGRKCKAVSLGAKRNLWRMPRGFYFLEISEERKLGIISWYSRVMSHHEAVKKHVEKLVQEQQWCCQTRERNSNWNRGKKGYQEDTTNTKLVLWREWLACLLQWSLKGDTIIFLMYLERKYQGRGKDYWSKRIILTWKQVAASWAWKWGRIDRRARNTFLASEQ